MNGKAGGMRNNVAFRALERQGGAFYRGRDMAAKPFPILFITASRIGDAVLSSGLVRALAAEIPKARFTIVGSALTAPLFAQTPGLERLIVMEKQPLGAHWIALWRQVRGKKWGLVVDLRGSGLSGLLSRSRRAVYGKSPLGGHKVLEAARLLKLDRSPPDPYLFTNPDIEARANALTKGPGPILAIAPAANWIGKTWPPERFAAIARRLLGSGGALAGGRLMVLGAYRDRLEADHVKAAVPSGRQIDLVGAEDLLVCHAALKHARLFIGNDSGLMHLAAAAGTPTLGLFGPSDETAYAPWGPSSRAVRGPRSFAEFRDIDPHLNHAVCHMMDLRTDIVLSAAEDLIDQTAQPASVSEHA
jgi:ADP-heptose:LPS heptosyltransferase